MNFTPLTEIPELLKPKNIDISNSVELDNYIDSYNKNTIAGIIKDKYFDYCFKFENYPQRIIFRFYKENNDLFNKKIINAKVLIKHQLLIHKIVFVQEESEKDFYISVIGNELISFLEIYDKFADWLKKEYLNQIIDDRYILIIKNELLNNIDNKKIKDDFINLIYKKEKDWANATELLANYILKKLYIKTTAVDDKSEIYYYSNGIYIPNGKVKIEEFLREILQEFFSSYVFNLVIDKIKADTRINYDIFHNSENKELICLENGILNVRTKELKEHTPDLYFFNRLPLKYDINSKCNNIENFLKEILTTENDILIFYEIVGFCLYKEYTWEKAFMFLGGGRNGKTKALELIKRFLGSLNCSALTLNDISKGGFYISRLLGKMANIAGDLDSADLKDTAIFKDLTGQGLRTADRKFLPPIEFINYAKMIFACNELPMVSDMSRGFWDRWILLDFPYTFVSKEELSVAKDKTKLKLRDPEIIDKISTQDELNGLLIKSLEGLDRLFQNKVFSYTKSTEDTKGDWIRKSNSFMAFCMDCIEEDYEESISKKELRKKYSDYCKNHKIVPKNDFIVKKTLTEIYGATDSKREIVGYWEHVWVGIKFK